MQSGPAVGLQERGIRAGEEVLLASALEAVHGLNERCLDLLQRLASGQPGSLPPFLKPLAPLLESLEPNTISVGARQPFLLIDFAFGNPTQFRELFATRPPPLRFPPPPGALPAADATALARGALILAQSVCRHHPAHAGLLMGVDFALHAQIAQLRLPDLERLAEAYPQYLRLRWDRQVEIWRSLLAASASLDPERLNQFRMYGIQLMASSLQAPGRGR